MVAHQLTAIGLAIAVCVSACTSAETSLAEPPGPPPPATTAGPPETSPFEQPDPTPPANEAGSIPTESDSRPAESTPGPASSGRVKYIEWITSFGVAGGPDFPDEHVVALLASGDCAEARQTTREPEGASLPAIYDAASAACLAAFHGRSDLWPYAESVAAQSTSPRNCFDRAVADLLRRLVDIHREDPNAQLERQPTGRGETLSCPRIVQLIPEHGPPQGGYPLRIVGVHLPPTVVIHFVQYIDLEAMDAVITARSVSGTEAVITVPPQLLGAEREVSIYPDEWPYGPLNTPFFVYDNAPKIESTAASTAAPSPTSDPANGASEENDQ